MHQPVMMLNYMKLSFLIDLKQLDVPVPLIFSRSEKHFTQRGIETWESPLLATLQDKNGQGYEDHSIQHW